VKALLLRIHYPTDRLQGHNKLNFVLTSSLQTCTFSRYEAIHYSRCSVMDTFRNFNHSHFLKTVRTKHFTNISQLLTLTQYISTYNTQPVHKIPSGRLAHGGGLVTLHSFDFLYEPDPHGAVCDRAKIPLRARRNTDR
jgi:hypothetical protein